MIELESLTENTYLIYIPHSGRSSAKAHSVSFTGIEFLYPIMTG